MARDIDFGDLSHEDKIHIRQRPWLVTEAKLQGHDIYDEVHEGVEPDPSGTATSTITTDDLRAGTPDPGSSSDEAEESKDDEHPEDDYDEWTKPELTEELTRRELPVGGNKDEQIARLRENDTE